MEFLKEEYLKPATPYMLRNDGTVIECFPMHPYLKYIIQDNNNNQIEYLFNKHPEFIDWFYNNTNHEEVKNEIKLFVNSVLNNNAYNIDNKDIFNQYLTDTIVLNIEDIEEIYLELNNELNQEFCRIRTSDMRFGGTSGNTYFRISSTDFNWFNIIWKLVYDNRNFITNVTICTDAQSKCGRPQFYNHNGIIINELPVDNFLNLSGNPVIEKKDIISNDLQSGKSLMESLSYVYPGHINNYFNIKLSNYINHNFK